VRTRWPPSRASSGRRRRGLYPTTVDGVPRLASRPVASVLRPPSRALSGRRRRGRYLAVVTSVLRPPSRSSSGRRHYSSVRRLADQMKRRPERSPDCSRQVLRATHYPACRTASLAHPPSSHACQVTKGKQSPSQTPLKFVGLRV